jgi:hypothetical protein
MTRTVWKFSLPLADEIELVMPSGADILHFDMQFNRPVIWALVDPENKEVVTRKFRFAGTGHKIETANELRYIGSCMIQDGALVFHLFEVIGE